MKPYGLKLALLVVLASPFGASFRIAEAQEPFTATALLDAHVIEEMEELGIREEFARTARVSKSSRSALRYRLGLDQPIAVELPTPTGVERFQLRSYDIRSENYQAWITTDTGLKPDPTRVHLFEGHAEHNSDAAHVALIIDETGNARAIRGALFNEGVALSITSGSDARLLKIATTPTEGYSCGVWEPQLGQITTTPREQSASTGVRILELATDADWELSSHYGVQTNAEILAAIALSTSVLENQLGVRVDVVFQHAWNTPSDPYSVPDVHVLIDELKVHWDAVFAPVVSYDSVHLFTGHTDLGSAAGVAHFQGACHFSGGSSVSGFRYSHTPTGAFFGPMDHANTIIAAEVFTHEMGHLLGSPHDICDASSPYIMCEPSEPNFLFSPGSVSLIRAHITGPNGLCLSVIPDEFGGPEPPNLLPRGPYTVEEGTQLDVFDFMIVDPNGHLYSDYLYSFEPLPSWATVTTSPTFFTRSVIASPPLDTVIGCIDGPQKEFHYTATVTDPTGLSDSEEGVIIVKNKNTAPTLSALAAAPQLQPGETISRTLAASDPDCDDILFVNTYGNAAAFTSFNSANGAFTWRAPDCAAPAQYTLRFVAVDRQGAHSNAIEFPISVAGGGSLNCEADSDGDGVSDNTENTLGTAPDDPGSFAAPLSSPVYALWNGFLGMINILELVNTSSFEQSVTVTLYKGDGSQGGVQSYLVPAQSQFDVILNTMLSGFAADEIGLVKIQFAGALDGRMFFYRPDAAFGYEFAFGVPLSNPSTRSTAVGFNTFQPSNNPGDSVNIVANWLGLVNLESSPRSFSVYKYNQVGKFLNVTDVTVPPRGRIDIEAGHVNPGSSQVGVNEIHPHDPTTRYLAQLYRYGGDAPAVFAPVTYSFAFPLLSLTPNGQSTSVPISTRFGGENWVELVNPTGSQVGVFVQYLNAAGLSAGTESITLDPHSQLHLFASGRLGAEETGVAVITPTVTNSIVAQSMFYFRDPATGGIRSMYGSQLREAVGTTALGSYNLFLGMESYARLFNSTAAPRAVGVTLRSLGMTLSTHQITVPANGTAELQLHDTATYNTSADSYGVLILEPDLAGSVFADILRVRRNGGALDFVAPTPVR